MAKVIKSGAQNRHAQLIGIPVLVLGAFCFGLVLTNAQPSKTRASQQNTSSKTSDTKPLSEPSQTQTEDQLPLVNNSSAATSSSATPTQQESAPVAATPSTDTSTPAATAPAASSAVPDVTPVPASTTDSSKDSSAKPSTLSQSLRNFFSGLLH